MANKKSVIEIDIQDSKWKAFMGEFAKFGKASKEQAGDTAAAADAQAKLNTEKKKGADAEKTAAKDRKTAAADAAKSAKEAYDAERKKYAAQSKAVDDKRKARADDMKALRDSAKWTADIARNVASTAFNAAKWVAFGAIASGFGLGGLASSAAGSRRQAQGLGVNTGELRAASVNFGKYIDPESALANIANTKDSNDRWIFNRAGVDTRGKNPGEILADYLPKVVAAFKGVGGNTSAAESTGLTKVIGIEDLRRLSSLTEKELSDTIQAYRKDRESLNVDDATGRGWQDFLVSMRRAGEGIEVSLIKNLQTLTPYLQKFADGIAKAIDTFVSSGGLQNWIEKVGAALEKLGSYLGSKEFATDVESFMSAIHTMATFLGKLFPKAADAPQTPAGVAGTAPGASPAVGGFKAAMNVYGAIWDHLTGKTPLAERNHNPGNLRIPGSTTGFQSFSNDNDGIKALAHQLQLYEGRDNLRTIRGIISKYAPGNENNTAAYIANVSKRTGFGADQALDPKSMDQLVKLVVAITKQENGRSNFTEAGIRVLIENQTGGSAHASVAALATN